MQLFLCTLEHKDVPTRKIEHSLAVTKGKAMREEEFLAKYEQECFVASASLPCFLPGLPYSTH